MIAEDVVLPMNKRSIKRTVAAEPPVETVRLEQREAATPSPTGTPYGQTVVIIDTKPSAPVKPECQFPIFMVFISMLQVMHFITKIENGEGNPHKTDPCLLFQVFLFYSIEATNLMLVFGYDPHRRHELWRFLSIMLAHSS